MPSVWLNRSLKVSSRFGLLPSRMRTSAYSGRYFETRSSNDIRPSSIAHITAAPVNVFVIEKMANSVFVEIGTRFSTFAQPEQSTVRLQFVSLRMLTTPEMRSERTYSSNVRLTMLRESFSGTIAHPTMNSTVADIAKKCNFILCILFICQHPHFSL